MKCPYLHLDVFSDEAFSGNQLAVFTAADGLSSSQMQRIASEMAFPETTFVLPAESADVDVRVRIFTPSRELPMAGHPTIGTAFALAAAEAIEIGAPRVTFGLGIGPTPVFLDWKDRALIFAWMKQPLPTFGAVTTHADLLAKALGVTIGDIEGSGLPVHEVSSGVPFLFVPLVSRAAVNRASCDRGLLRAFFAANDHPELPIFLFSLESGNDDVTAFSRMFAPLFGIPEDPATGGASGPLGAYLLRHGAVTPQQATRLVSLQGVAMGRPSRITISVMTRDEKIVDLRVGGTSVSVGAGYLNVPSENQ